MLFCSSRFFMQAKQGPRRPLSTLCCVMALQGLHQQVASIVFLV
jgi:hypothetical protein